LFDSAAELMSVPYLQARYGGKAPERVGLKHPSIAPYGSFVCSDGREVVLSIQNEREWAQFCQMVLKKPEMAAHPKFSSNAARVDNRQELEEIIQAVFGKLSYTAAIDLLIEAQTAFGSINSVYDLIEHPQLRTKEMDVHGMKVHVPANPFMMEWDAESFPPIPPIGAMRESNHHAPELNQAAELLARRFASGEHAEDLPAQIKPANRAQGYEIQRMLPARLNDRQVGWKIAATSEAGQRHIAVSGPIAGPLMKRRVHPNASTIELKDNLMRVAECEVAFRLNQTFKPRPNPYSKEEVIAAIGALMPAIEVPDSRFRAFERAGEAQLIADGACCRDMLLGQEVPPDERMLNLPQLDIVARCNDGREFQGCGANVLGDPLNSLHWLVNEVTRHGMCVEAGQFVITGTCTTPIPVEPGNTVHADLGWVGTMQVTFS
jgi:2-keto-4-pentenoate hydratase